MSWRDNLDPVLKDFLNSLLKEVQKQKKAYSEADDPAIAQIWTALSIIYRKILLLEREIEDIKGKISENDLKNKLEESLKKI
ncbi:hypothetical protein BA065_00565 [Nanoarchaeota archaeon NZ13-N]|uniref:Uncharacterized protein n=1 Tax=Candidatus Nanoclepta minutus TaxID=1940235 RepID=A0A397WR21_9ARCH|nr:MAG: hypothetical protein BA065_00565 [Nanoarchaeota archaeon NZ13-N]RIB35513.1 MAG: hypothetical protein BXU00_00165 [Candidatus Nanoclepta minutus]